MVTNEPLEISTGKEKIDGANLQPSFDALKATAVDLNDTIPLAPDVETVQAIGRVQEALNDHAKDLTVKQIDLLAGQALVTAAHINAATEAAKAAIEQMTDWKKKVSAAGKLVDFFAAVLTGDGTKMVETAYQLKDVL